MFCCLTEGRISIKGSPFLFSSGWELKDSDDYAWNNYKIDFVRNNNKFS